MKKFKVGDKCYTECTVTEIKNGLFDYPIVVEFANKERFTFTINGKYYTRDNMQTLKHIEDIIPKPEFPKWMMVKMDDKWVRRKVIYKDEFGYAFITSGGETLENNAVFSCKLAKEIEPENIKLQELEIKYKELGEEIEKLKNK